MRVILLIGVCCLAGVWSAEVRVDPLVRISQGLVRGRKASDGDYSTFLGIPYAQVDVNNPFGSALPAPSFGQEIFNAYDGSQQCPQTDRGSSFYDYTTQKQTLDCLILNIYVPNHASSYNPLPVLVWIYGGGFTIGFADQFHPRDLLKQGIIVVTINYRLGPYGFMCLDHPLVPGNQGLKDQYEALRWIRNNIGAFGGNPYKVTISGQSAGSFSALMHLFSSKDKLFSQVIAHSGTPLTEGVIRDGDSDAAIKLALYLGYNATENEQALEFLSQTPHELVTGAVKNLELQFRPCRERSFSGIQNFIETDPFSLWNEPKVRNTPIIIGSTDKEYLADLPSNLKSDLFYDTISEFFNLEEEELVEAASIMRHFYIGDEPISESVFSQLVDFKSDFVYNHPVQRSITGLLKQNANPVYEYMFSYVREPGAAGAKHTDDMYFLFDIAHKNYEHTDEGQLIVDKITTLWANFVKYGNPTPAPTELLPFTWKPATADTRPTLIIDTDTRLESRVFQDRMAFWDLFYSKYGQYHRLVRDCYKK